MNYQALNKLCQELGLIGHQTLISHQLTAEYTGNLDLDAALAKNERCWKKQALRQLDIKKSIVITSWYLGHYMDDNKTKILIIIDALIQEGFPVYLSIATGLLALTSVEMLVDSLPELHIISDHEARRLAMRHNINSDNLFILDTNTLIFLSEYVFYGEYFSMEVRMPGKNYVSIAKLTPDLSLIELKHMEKQITPTTPLNWSYNHFFMLNLATSPLRMQITRLNLDTVSNDIVTQIINTLPRIQKLVISSTWLEPAQLDQLLSLPDLKNLNLVVSTSLKTPTIDFKPNRLTHLTLGVACTNHIQLINTSPVLQYLEVKGVNFYQGGAIAPLTRLEVLRISGDVNPVLITSLLGAISEQIQAIEIVQVPNAISTTLAYCKSAEGHNKLKNLKSLYLDHSIEESVHTTELIASFKTLTTLYMNSCLGSNAVILSLVDHYEQTGHNPLAGLTLCTIRHCDLNARGLRALLLLAPALEMLSIEYCKQIDKDFEPFTMPAGYLTWLDASNTTLTEVQLQCLLEPQPKLTYLNLSFCKAIDSNALEKIIPLLPHLGKLDISPRKISLPSLQTLQKTNPELTRLNGKDYIHYNHCGQIVTASISNSDLIIPFLQGQQNLFKLSLADNSGERNHCPDLSPLAATQMNKLNMLQIIAVETTPDQLNLLLQKTRRLQILDLRILELGGPRLINRWPNERLKKVKLSGLSIHKQSILALLEGAINLELLDLNSIIITDNEHSPTLSSLNLPKLRRLTLGSKIQTKILYELLAATHELTHLDISHTKLSHPSLPVYNNEYKLQQLSLLNITGSNLTLQQLRLLINMAPNLETVSMKDYALCSIHELEWLRKSFPAIEFHHTYPDKHQQSLINHGISDIIKPNGDLCNDPETTFSPQKIFKSPPGVEEIHTTTYHLNSYIWNNNRQAFTRYQPNLKHAKRVHLPLLTPQQVRTQFETQSRNREEQYAQKEYTFVNQQIWYQLPATSTQDQLLALGVDVQIEPILDDYTGYYFFRVSQPHCHSLAINFIIHSGRHKSTSPNEHPNSFQQQIKNLGFNHRGRLYQTPEYLFLKAQSRQALLSELQTFCTFPLSSSANVTGSGADLLNHYIDIQAGACCHRAQLFTALATELEIPTLYIQNGSHAFVVALMGNGERITCNLGGAPCIENELPLDESLFTSPVNNTAIQRQIRMNAIQRQNPPALSNRFRVWDNLPLQAQSAVDLVVELLANPHPQPFSLAREKGADQGMKRLLETVDYATIEALHEALLVYPPAREQTYISSCLDAIKLHESALIDGVYQKVPSPLALFLEKARENPAQHFTWFINWSNARSEHTTLNCLIDNQKPRLNDQALPENINLIILIDKISAESMGDEFNSRLPLRSQVPKLNLPARPAEPSQPLSEEAILLIQENEWSKELLGYFTKAEQACLFRYGALLEAIHQERTAITIHNAPWHNPQFRWFERELRIGRRVYANGQEQALPPGLVIGYAKPQFTNTINASPLLELPSDLQLVLNQSTWASLFNRVTLTDNGLNEIHGLLAHFSGRLILFRVNENLSALQWYKIDQEARKYSISWAIHATPGIKIPSFLTVRLYEPEKIITTRNTGITISNDLDYALHRELDIPREKPLTLIPVSQTSGFDSLFVNPWYDNKGHLFGRETMLLQALRAGESICFFGTFSTDLVNRMASLFTNPRVLIVNGEIIPITGDIRLISNDAEAFKTFDYTQATFQPNPGLPLSDGCGSDDLYTQFKITPCFSHLGYCPSELKRQLYIMANQPLPATMPQSSSSIQPGDKPTEPGDLLDALERSPFVFLMGETGTGKTWLMTKALPAYAKKMGIDLTLCFNLSNIKQWLAKREGLVILFIDEADLSDEVYHLFENLARGERVVWLDGQRFELTPGQKVVFSSNHPSYGGRKQAEIFKRYPCFINFKGHGLEPILQPSLQCFFDDPATHLAEINHWYYLARSADLTITPRNAEMIGLHAFALKKSHPYFPESLLFKYAIMTALKGLCFNPEKTRELRRQLKQTPDWQAQANILKIHLCEKLPRTSTKDFIWTPSRQKIALTIFALLRIRQNKIDGIHDQGSGINGLVLEGMPGLGKSKLIIAILTELKIPFIILSTNADEAREQLIFAFHQGLLVVIDELNTFPHELLLNDLLSNLDPEKQAARKNGFCILATQNPASLKKRNILSKAMANRLITLTLKEYTVVELQKILEQSYELSAQEAMTLIEEWLEAKSYARQENILEPDTRTLFIEAGKRVVVEDVEETDDVHGCCGIM